jgi:pyruvate,orthophosphate dikinase
VLVERLVLSDSDDERNSVLEELGKLQRQDFEEILHQMSGLPVTVRLIDPPLHEFLPDLTELSVRVALAAQNGPETADDVRLLAAVRRLHEDNPMLGLRGVRLAIVVPGLVRMQVRALAEAAVAVAHVETPPAIEIMVPLVASVRELASVAAECRDVIAEVEAESGQSIDYTIGTMIELPRAALTAGEIAVAADFFSFGTNDLTQTTWGLSRDDAERSLIPRYLEVGIFPSSPFDEIDVAGVGRLVQLAVTEGRSANPSLHTGVCGEHGGNPASVHFFDAAGLDYVSCSPFRVPVARLEAGRAALMSRRGG